MNTVSKSRMRKINTGELFSSEEQRQEATTEKILRLPLGELFPFHDHPFKVREDESMTTLMGSIEKHGVSDPVLARPRPEGGYELVSGHRRHRACQLLGMETIPVQVRNMDDDTAAILMVDTNLEQRQEKSFSEKAFAYKIWLDATKRQAGRPSKENVSQLGTQKRNDQKLAEQTGESRNQIQRYVRLTFLNPPLLTMVDEKKIAFNPAVELSYLTPEEQTNLLDAMDMEQTTPSLSQAQRLKKLSQQNACSHEVMCAIMSEQKKTEKSKSIFDDKDFLKELTSFFPANTPPQVQKKTLLRLLQSSNIKTLLAPQKER